MVNENEMNAGDKTIEFKGHHLDSWKEIAAYVNRNVRTAQRWEKTEGLPVHRHRHERASSVSACREEIDRWQKQRLHVSDEIAVKQRELETLIEKLRMALLVKRMREALATALEVHEPKNLFASRPQDVLAAAEDGFRVD